MDLAILIDGSQSIEYFAKGNFKRCLEFVKNLLRGFNIAREGTHAGIVVFSHIAEVVFGFEKYLSLGPMLQTIDHIKYPKSSTYTGKALDVVRTQLFDASARQGVPNVLLVMTDGASQVGIFYTTLKIEFSKITDCLKLTSKQHHNKVLLNSFPINGRSLGVLSIESKVRKLYITQGSTLGVKGLMLY